MSGRTVAVFGSSEPLEGDPIYEAARATGRLLAAAGFAVATGGYGGVMEAASRGASESGGRAIGVTCSIFPERSANRWLTEVRETADLHERQRVLVEIADGYVVLPGKSGTLAELTLVWALHRAGSLPHRPVVLLGAGWVHFLRHLVQGSMIEPEQLAITRAVGTPEEAVGVVDAFLAAEG
ncbi:MAG TPA: LOG family protein [Candidatus Polarisedimenticolaceae bacterium]